jgi:hypothetical protein
MFDQVTVSPQLCLMKVNERGSGAAGELGGIIANELSTDHALRAAEGGAVELAHHLRVGPGHLGFRV